MKDSEEKSGPHTDSYIISDLEQMKVLADPLRIRILECFCQGERTTKQVAEELREKPTRLYHHVDALLRVGLIELVRTQQNRGTLEKYYLAVARRFEADTRVFSTAEESEEGRNSLQSMVTSILGRTSQELSELIAAGQAQQAIEQEGLLSFIEIRADKEQLLNLREKLKALLESAAEECSESKDDRSSTRYRLTLAFFPLNLDS